MLPIENVMPDFNYTLLLSNRKQIYILQKQMTFTIIEIT